MSSTNLYHGSPHKIEGKFQPVLRHSTVEHIHTKPAVFATEKIGGRVFDATEVVIVSKSGDKVKISFRGHEYEKDPAE